MQDTVNESSLHYSIYTVGVMDTADVSPSSWSQIYFNKSYSIPEPTPVPEPETILEKEEVESKSEGIPLPASFVVLEISLGILVIQKKYQF